MTTLYTLVIKTLYTLIWLWEIIPFQISLLAFAILGVSIFIATMIYLTIKFGEDEEKKLFSIFQSPPARVTLGILIAIPAALMLMLHIYTPSPRIDDVNTIDVMRIILLAEWVIFGLTLIVNGKINMRYRTGGELALWRHHDDLIAFFTSLGLGIFLNLLGLFMIWLSFTETPYPRPPGTTDAIEFARVTGSIAIIAGLIFIYKSIRNWPKKP